MSARCSCWVIGSCFSRKNSVISFWIWCCRAVGVVLVGRRLSSRILGFSGGFKLWRSLGSGG